MDRTESRVDDAPISFELPPPAAREESFWFEPQKVLAINVTRFDRRDKSRQVIRVQARIRPDGRAALDARTIDLSLHGLAITSARPLNVDQECDVELGISVPALDYPPALRASVRYCARMGDQYRIGMKFTEVSIEAAELIVAALKG